MKLEIKNIYFSYKKQNVLDDISFDLNLGEMLSIVGSNGVGKTTLLKCINGILTPNKGSILFDDKDLLSLSQKEKAKIIGYVPQSTYAEDSSLSVFDTVLLGRLPHKKIKFTDEDMQIASDSIKEMGLEKYSFKSINTLSGGERQRVFLARTLAQAPKILLLDEPISNLDLKYQLDTMNLIRNLASKNNIGIITILHDLNFAIYYSDLVLLLENGSVFDIDVPEKVLNKHNIYEMFQVDAQIFKVKNKNYIYPFKN